MADDLDRTVDHLFTLGEHTLDVRGGLLRDRDGRPVQLRPQAWAVLACLARQAGRVVTKSELLEQVWPGLVVAESSVARAVCDLRDALGDHDGEIVRTVPRRGYMLALAEATTRASDGVAEASSRRVIAVLAFKGLGDEEGVDALASGVALQLSYELARNSDLRVVSHHSSFAFRGSSVPLAEISRRLGCRYLVDGAVLRSGSQAHLVVELIDGIDGHIVWTDRHDLVDGDLRFLGDQIRQRLAAGVSLSAFYAEASRIRATPPRNLDVYALTMLSMRFYDDFEPAAIAPARALLERALELDGDYAPAWAWLAMLEASAIGGAITDEHPPEALDRSISLATRAINLDRGNVVAWRALGYAHILAGRFDAALAAATRSVELAPSNADSLRALSFIQLRCGYVEDALRSIEAASEMHPLRTPWVCHSLAQALWGCNRPDQALRVLAGETVPPSWVLVCCRAECKDEQGAQAEGARYLRMFPALRVAHLLVNWSENAAGLRSRLRRGCLVGHIPE
jgi:TolB-like protein